MLRNVYLSGELARLADADVLRIDVETPAEAVRALCSQVRGARRAIGESSWRVLARGRDLDGGELVLHGPGDYELVPMLEGASDDGGGGWKILAGVLLIVASVFTGGATLQGATGFFIKLGAAVALSGVAQALAPRPRTPQYMEQEPAERRQSWLFSGAGNLTAAGQSVPLVYGRILAGSIAASLGVEARVGAAELLDWKITDGALRSDAWLRVVDILSEGEIVGLVNGDASIWLDDQRVAELSGSKNLEAINYELIPGASPSPGTGVIPQTEREIGVGVRIHKKWTDIGDPSAGSVERTITDPNVDAVRITVSTPSLWALPAGSYIPTAVVVKVQVSADGGAFQWLTDGAWLHPGPQEGVNGLTPTSADATGLWARLQAWYPLYTVGTDAVVWLSYNLTGTYPGTPVVQTREIVDVGASGSAVFDIPIRLTQNAWYWWLEEGGPPSDSWQWQVNTILPWFHLQGTSFGTYEASGVVNLRDFGDPPYVVRLVRMTADNTTPTTLANDTYWARYSELVRADMLHEGTAVMLLEAGAEALGGSIPRRAYELDGRKIRVPTGYTVATRTYPGTWDGTWQPTKEWSDNPAFVLWDLLTDAACLDLPDASVDKWSLYEAAKYCDELVDDGAAGTEPRFRFNHQFGAREQGYKVLTAVASAMRATVWWANGQVFVSQDRPSDPVRVFSRANVIGGEFKYVGAARSSRYGIAHVSWRDPAARYEHQVDAVDKPWMVDRYGDRALEIRAIGTTHRGQARRDGRWILDTAAHEGGQIVFRVGLADIGVGIGEIIEISDEHREQVRYGGRVSGRDTGDLTHLPIDAGVLLTTGTSYTLRVQGSGGVVLERTLVVPTTTTYTTLEVSAAFGASVQPLVNAPWSITTTAVPSRQYRVLAIAEADDAAYEITAVYHDPGKYARVETFTSSDGPPAAPTIDTPPVPASLDLVGEWYVDPATGDPVKSIRSTWTSGAYDPPQWYEATLVGSVSGSWRTMTRDPVWRVYPITDGQTFTLNVRNVDALFTARSAYAPHVEAITIA